MAATKKKTGRASDRAAPWTHPAPPRTARKQPKSLTPAQKAHAKARARKAGRPYPNLVDNMHEASEGRASGRGSGKKATPRKSRGRTATTRARGARDRRAG